MIRLPPLLLLTILVTLVLIPAPALAAILGIDFGQSNTKAALVSPGVPFEIVLTADSKRKDVSGIAFKGEERLYGSSAAGIAPRSPSTAFLHFKPLLGRSVSSSEAEMYLAQHPGMELIPSGNRSTVAFKTPDSSFPVEEVLAMSLSNIKNLAEEMLPKSSATSRIYDVAITVPPYFDSVQRKAIIDAAEIAGLRVTALVPDGVATAINYASSRSFGNEKQYHFVLDMGAGSTSATLISFQEIQDGGLRFGKTALSITVEGVGFDHTLGGNLLDQRIFEILLARFIEAHGDGILSSPRALVRLHKEAERVKTILSANSEVRVSVESLHGDIDFRTMVSRTEFEEAIHDILPRISKPFEDALKAAKLDILDVQSVILMGGTTRVPIFQQVLVNDVLKGDASKVSKNVNADEAAVMGATFRGVSVSKQFKTKEINVLDPTIWEYDVVISDSDGRPVGAQILFPEGSLVVGNRSLIELQISEDVEEATLEFREGGRPLFTYGLHGIQEAKKKLLLANNCSELIPVIDAELTVSRVFEVHGISLQCNVTRPAESDDSEGEDFRQKVFNFFKGEKSSSSEESTTASETTAAAEAPTDSESTTTTPTATSEKSKATSRPKPRLVKQPMKYKIFYSGPRNMGRATKASSQARLRAFDKLDSDRHARDAVRNDVESYSYRIREWIEYEHQRFLEHLSEEERQTFLNKAESALEWLYGEGESMILDKLKEKMKELKEFEMIVFQREKEKLASIEAELRASASAAAAEVSAEVDGVEELVIPDDEEEETAAETSTSATVATATTTLMPNTETVSFEQSSTVETEPEETADLQHDEL
ncbi:Hsp70 protein-domain-containing protein [Lipomyces tetrasporus]|uniref:Hsp70 protein-domain-containing protein n=1 Tax=Lipomyces tetrasporus TaxID=54092 RepID=A0AAD7VVE7_9ASCO|nr:Hsp70 protein-domain-containing protein [Lipomyces tetrasporus]KAJ8102894.1 Hsp70 protein-domain-containing protein [Lipomyces tetrasporus]